MFKRNLAGVVVAGLLLGAGASQADTSPFPYSVQEVPVAWYADRIANPVVRPGAASNVAAFPTSVADTGPNYPRPVASATPIARAGANVQTLVHVPAFPSSVSDTGPNYPRPVARSTATARAGGSVHAHVRVPAFPSSVSETGPNRPAFTSAV